MRVETDGTKASRITDIGSGIMETGVDGRHPGRG